MKRAKRDETSPKLPPASTLRLPPGSTAPFALQQERRYPQQQQQQQQQQYLRQQQQLQQPVQTRQSLMGPYLQLFQFYADHVDNHMPTGQEKYMTKFEQWRTFILNQLSSLNKPSSALAPLTPKQEEAITKAIHFVQKWNEQYYKAVNKVQTAAASAAAAAATAADQGAARPLSLQGETSSKADFERELELMQRGLSHQPYLAFHRHEGPAAAASAAPGVGDMQQRQYEHQLGGYMQARSPWEMLQAKVETLLREGRDSKRLAVLKSVPALLADALDDRGLPREGFPYPASSSLYSSRTESTADLLKRLRLTFNAALAGLAQSKVEEQHQGGEKGDSSSSSGAPIGNGFVEACGLLRQVDVLLQDLRDRQEAEESGESPRQRYHQQQQRRQAAVVGRGTQTRTSEAWKDEEGRKGGGKGDPQTIQLYLNALEEVSSASGHPSLSSFSSSPTPPSRLLFFACVDPNARWLEALASPAAGIRNVDALRSALEDCAHLKGIVLAGTKGPNGKLIAKCGGVKGEMWKAEVHLKTRLTLAERARAPAAAAAMGATLFPLLVRVTLVGNKNSAWSERVDEEIQAALLQWREWTKDDVVKTVAAVLEEIRIRVRPGARCDLTGRALKLDGASLEPVPPYTPCTSSSCGSGVAYQLQL